MAFRFRPSFEALEQRDNPSGLDPVDSTGAPVTPPPPQPAQLPPPVPVVVDTSGGPRS
jgi:hypothetical protein